MPIYEFQCTSCNHRFELFTHQTDPDRASREAPCPQCKSSNVERQFSVFAAHANQERQPSVPSGGGCGRCGDPAGPCGSGTF